MKNNIAYIWLGVIALLLVIGAQAFSLMDHAFKLQSLEQEQQYLKERLNKVERYSHAH